MIDLDFLKKLPISPGVYLHKDRNNEILYVGKAKNLKKRVSSYFTKKDHDPKTAALVKNIITTDVIVTNNEVEALLLENRLIKQYKPKYNIELRDAARYFYIQVTKEEFPRILVTRQINKTDYFFGPYTSTMGDILKITRELFKLRSCGQVLPKRTCIYYDLNLCTAPCEDKISKADYQKNVEEAMELIKSGSPKLKHTYFETMKEFAQKQQYEKALEFKKRIEVLERLEQRQIVDVRGRHDQDVIGIAELGEQAHICVLKSKKGVMLNKEDFSFERSDDLLNEFLKAYYTQYAPPNEIIVDRAFDPAIELFLRDISKRAVYIVEGTRGAKKELVDLARKNAYVNFNLEDPVLIEMKNDLRLNKLPYVIDCFDISNIGESVIVGACVQFKNKQPFKSGWRLYTIKGDFGQDDFRSMHEVIKRRYSKEPLPDLLLIDGGLIQVDFVVRALKELGLECAVVGLAKKEERIVFPEGDSFVLARRKEYAKLIMRIRDAVHAFAVRFSRTRYKNTYKKSELDLIFGVGQKTKFELLHAFGSVENLKGASLEDIEKVVGVKRARLVYDYFHKNKKIL